MSQNNNYNTKDNKLVDEWKNYPNRNNDLDHHKATRQLVLPKQVQDFHVQWKCSFYCWLSNVIGYVMVRNSLTIRKVSKWLESVFCIVLKTIWEFPWVKKVLGCEFCFYILLFSGSKIFFLLFGILIWTDQIEQIHWRLNKTDFFKVSRCLFFYNLRKLNKLVI